MRKCTFLSHSAFVHPFAVTGGRDAQKGGGEGSLSTHQRVRGVWKKERTRTAFARSLTTGGDAVSSISVPHLHVNEWGGEAKGPAFACSIRA
jgi:hypothetical protein